MPRANKPRTLTLWHATYRRFKKFDPNRSGLGTHFGIRRQAVARMEIRELATWRLCKYKIRVKNPLFLMDAENWSNPERVLAEMLDAEGTSGFSFFSEDDPRYTRAVDIAYNCEYFFNIDHQHDDVMMTPADYRSFWRYLRKIIEQAGYDCIEYDNMYEAFDEDFASSYIIWNPKQIISAQTEYPQ